MYTLRDYATTFDFLKRAKGIGLPISKLITHRFPLEQINEAHVLSIPLIFNIFSVSSSGLGITWVVITPVISFALFTAASTAASTAVTLPLNLIATVPA